MRDFQIIHYLNLSQKITCCAIHHVEKVIFIINNGGNEYNGAEFEQYPDAQIIEQKCE